MKAATKVIASVPKGHYVVAISGGVDSMVLLDMLVRQTTCTFVVAHVDHGIRPDSLQDYLLVQNTARHYKRRFYGCRVSLGAAASEAIARKVRYDFLLSVQQREGADGLMTAHHQDDMVESVILQVARGTYRKGLSPLRHQNIVRPLLTYTKEQLKTYATDHAIKWREDSTNSDTTYTRNRLRVSLSNDNSNKAAHTELLDITQTMSIQNQTIDKELLRLESWLLESDAIVRWKFAQLPHAVARDYVAFYLRNRGVQFDSKLIEKIAVALKVQKPHSRVSIGVKTFLEISSKTAQLLVQ
jgi:tRNA(Ile)-lysidine synthase